MNKKVIIYASTIGPFTGFSKFFVIKCLKKVDLIFCRDEKSYSFLVSSGLSKDNVKRTADCVLLLRENNSKRVANLVHDLDISKKTIGIFLKSFIYFTKTEFCKYLFDVKKVVIELERQNYRIIFFSANNVDCKLTKKFIKDYSIRNPFINLMDFSASESKKILANLGLIITSRMHPAILGTTAGTVVIGVSDESKMLEYLKIINNSKLYLDAKDYSFFSIINLIQYVYSNKEKISFDLKEGVLDAQKLASKNVLYMRDFIGKDSDFHEGSCN